MHANLTLYHTKTTSNALEEKALWSIVGKGENAGYHLSSANAYNFGKVKTLLARKGLIEDMFFSVKDRNLFH